QLDDHSREFTALRGLLLYHLNLLEMEKAQHFAEEALHVAERLGDSARLFGGTWHSARRYSSRGNSSRHLRAVGGASRCSIRTCSSRIGRVPTPACNASATWRSCLGCSVTRIGPSR